jgi:sensor c-di-GMP phosphodiesterase-like protein
MMAAAEYVRGTEDIELAVDLQLPDLKALAERIISLSHSLGMKMVADGVEMAAQRDLLLGHGCHFGQGWLFGCPIRQAPI